MLDMHGSWRHLTGKDENYAAFLKDMGVTEEKVTMMTSPSPYIIDIVQKGDEFSIVAKMNSSIREHNFRIGQKFPDGKFNDGEMRVPVWEDGKMVIRTAEGADNWITSIAIDNDHLFQTYESPRGVTATRHYERIRNSNDC